MMASLASSTRNQGLQALSTARGLALWGPGGTVFLSNRQLAAVAEFAIALQDLIQPNPDLEANGDELDGANSEDEFMLHSLWQGGAECPIADPGGCEHDGREPDEGCQ
jgi:hypothetical protein